MRVIAFDPGVNTGVAVFGQWGERIGYCTIKCENKKLTHDVYHAIASLMQRYNQDHVHYAYESGPIDVKSLRPQSYAPVVVIERFHTASAAVGSSWSGVMTAMLCGFIDGCAQLMQLPVVWQNSSERKPFEEDAKAMPHTDDHQVSATAHGLCYLTRQGVLGQARHVPSPVP